MRRAGLLICDRLFAPPDWGGSLLWRLCRTLISVMLLKWRSLSHNTWTRPALWFYRLASRGGGGGGGWGREEGSRVLAGKDWWLLVEAVDLLRVLTSSTDTWSYMKYQMVFIHSHPTVWSTRTTSALYLWCSNTAKLNIQPVLQSWRTMVS